MCTGTHPWPYCKENLQFFYKLIHLKENEMPEFELDENASDRLKDFLKCTFIINYAKRPSSSDLLEHDFIKLERSLTVKNNYFH